MLERELTDGLKKPRSRAPIELRRLLFVLNSWLNLVDDALAPQNLSMLTLGNHMASDEELWPLKRGIAGAFAPATTRAVESESRAKPARANLM